MHKLWLWLFLLVCCNGVQARPDFHTKTLREQQEPGGALPGYQIQADYPEFSAPLSARLNQRSLQLLQADLKRFKDDYQSLSSGPGSHRWNYWAEVTVESASPKITSVVYTVTAREDGEHPRFYFLSQTFTPQTGHVWKLDDYFLAGTPWLARLSVCSVDRLKKQIHKKFDSAGDADIEKGAAPRRENFKHVIPTSTGLRVYFPTGQIGPNLVGTQEVTIPYQEFRGMLSKSLAP